jgi:hypothetical protein
MDSTHSRKKDRITPIRPMRTACGQSADHLARSRPKAGNGARHQPHQEQLKAVRNSAFWDGRKSRTIATSDDIPEASRGHPRVELEFEPETDLGDLAQRPWSFGVRPLTQADVKPEAHPEGGRTTTHALEKFSRDDVSKIFQSPSGRHATSRRIGCDPLWKSRETAYLKRCWIAEGLKNPAPHRPNATPSNRPEQSTLATEAQLSSQRSAAAKAEVADP